MSKFKTLWLILLLPLLLFFPRHLSCAQTELTVSINVGDTILTLSGKTSPNASVTVIESGSVVGTTTADASGNFSKSLLAQTPGIHNIGIYATDAKGVTTSTVTYSVSLASLVETTLSNIVLPPTINLSGTGIAKGETVDIYGYGVVSSTISLLITGQTMVNTTSDSSGYWKYSFGTGNLTVGSTYDVYAKVTTTVGYQSESSKTLSFKIQTAPTATPAPTATSTPTSEVTATPSPVPTPRSVIPLVVAVFDIDGSGRIEVTEVFEAVKGWVEEWRGVLKEEKELKKCDINRDQRCNLIDLSILLYYVGR